MYIYIYIYIYIYYKVLIYMSVSMPEDQCIYSKIYFFGISNLR